MMSLESKNLQKYGKIKQHIPLVFWDGFWKKNVDPKKTLSYNQKNKVKKKIFCKAILPVLTRLSIQQIK